MDQLKEVFSWVPSVLTGSLVFALALWKGDALISDAGAKRLYGAISQTVNSPRDSQIGHSLESLLDGYFSLEHGWPRFLKNVFVLTLASLLFLLSIYAYKIPEIRPLLLSKGFLRQFFGNGFVVTFVTNCFLFSQYKRLIRSFVSDSLARNLVLLGSDMLLKAGLFIILTLFTYFVFALTTDAFMSNIRAVPRVVATTILMALKFQNLTGVYLYSLVVSSFPVFLVVLIKLMIVSPALAKAIQAIFFWLPFEGKPIRAIGVAFSVLAATFALTFAILLSWVVVGK